MTSPFGRARSIKGTNDFLAVSKRLKAAGETGLRKELNRALQQAAKPLIPKVRAAGQAQFPQAGGLAKRMGKKPYRVQVRTGAKTAGVRIAGTKVDPRMDATGRIAHPVFGRPNSTVVQVVPDVKGYFSDTIRAEAPQIRGELVKTLGDFVNSIARKGF